MRPPFRVKTAQAIFQQIMDTMLTGVDGASVYIDNIIVVGQSSNELTEWISNVLTCIQDWFPSSTGKFHFYLPSIKYLGFIFDKEGHHADPANVVAIQ